MNSLSQVLATDPRRENAVFGYQKLPEDPEQLPPDYYSILSLFFGMIGYIGKIKVSSWLALLFSVASIATMKSSHMDPKQLMFSVMFGVMGVTTNYRHQ